MKDYKLTEKEIDGKMHYFSTFKMETPVDTAYCLDTFEPHDGGVVSYYNVMTDHKAFAEEHEKWKSAFRKRVESEQIQKCISGIKEKSKML